MKRIAASRVRRELRQLPHLRDYADLCERSDAVGIYPNDSSLIRVAGALLLEQNDEWLVGRRYLSAESLAGLYAAARADEPQRPAPTAREVLLLTTR